MWGKSNDTTYLTLRDIERPKSDFEPLYLVKEMRLAICYCYTIIEKHMGSIVAQP